MQLAEAAGNGHPPDGTKTADASSLALCGLPPSGVIQGRRLGDDFTRETVSAIAQTRGISIVRSLSAEPAKQVRSMTWLVQKSGADCWQKDRPISRFPRSHPCPDRPLSTLT